MLIRCLFGVDEWPRRGGRLGQTALMDLGDVPLNTNMENSWPVMSISRRLPRLPLGRSLVGLDRTSFGHRGSSRKHTACVKSPTGAEQTGVGLFRSARPGFLKAQPMRKGLTSASESDDDDNAFCFRSRGSRILEARSQHISAMLVVVRIQRDRHLDRRLGSVRSHIPKSWVRENLGC